VQKPPSKKLEGVEWVDRAATGSVPMGTEENIAQGVSRLISSPHIFENACLLFFYGITDPNSHAMIYR